MKRAIMIGGIALFILLIGLGSVIYTTSPGRKIHKQLDLGNTYLEELNYEKAIVYFEAVIQIDPNNADAYLGLAMAYAGIGDEEQAITAYMRVISLQEDNVQAYVDLANILIGQEKYKEAEEILIKGISITNSYTLRSMLDEVQKKIHDVQEVTEELIVEKDYKAPVVIDSENFPDPVFRNYLKKNFDTNGDGVFDEEEISKVEWIDVSGSVGNKLACYSLEGVQYFSNLVHLNCDCLMLNSLDVSHNVHLDILGCSGNNLTELDVSNNKELTLLGCFDNKLTDLDLSNNSKLIELSCQKNQFTSLDLSHNTALERLFCGGNPIESLDLSQNKLLGLLNCANTPLESVDISNNPKLVKIIADDDVTFIK